MQMPEAGTPRLLIVGRDPGETEDKTGIPFHPKAPAGQLLRTSMAALNLLPVSAFTNSVHCHTPNNRGPKADEVMACQPWLLMDVRRAKPDLILALGQESLEALLNWTDYKPKKPRYPIGEWHGQLVGSFLNTPVMAAYHPSGGLRNSKLRRAMMGDLRKAAEYLGVVGPKPCDTWRIFDLDKPGRPAPHRGDTLGVDIETDQSGNILGVGIAVRDPAMVEWDPPGTPVPVVALYFPWRKDCPDFLSWYFEDQTLVFHNAKFDVPILEAAGVHIHESQVHDTILMAYVLRRSQTVGSIGLKELAAADLGLSWPTIEELGLPDEMTLEQVAEYCCQDAAASLLLYEKYEEELRYA